MSNMSKLDALSEAFSPPCYRIYGSVLDMFPSATCDYFCYCHTTYNSHSIKHDTDSDIS